MINFGPTGLFVNWIFKKFNKNWLCGGWAENLQTPVTCDHYEGVSVGKWVISTIFTTT